MYVGILVTPKLYDATSIKSDSNLQANSSLKLSLAKQGMDLYGNTVDYQEFPGGGYVMTIDNENRKSKIANILVQSNHRREDVFLASAAE